MAEKEKKQTPSEGSKVRILLFKIFLVLFAVLLFLSLISYNPTDIAIVNGGSIGQVNNWIGVGGVIAAKHLFLLFGLTAYFISFLFLVFTIQSFSLNPFFKKRGFIICHLFLIFGLCMLLGMFPVELINLLEPLNLGREAAPLSALPGGIIGQLLASPPSGELQGGIVRNYIGDIGCGASSIAFIIAGTVFLWRKETIELFKKLVPIFLLKQNFFSFSKSEKVLDNNELNEKKILKSKKNIKESKSKVKEAKSLSAAEGSKTLDKSDEEKFSPPPLSAEENKNPENLTQTNNSSSKYKLPTLNLLKDIQESKGDSRNIVQEAMKTLQNTLNSFGVDANVTDAVTGPRITRFEVVPEPGIRVQKISSIESNIKLDLRAESIRILAPIPGKDAVGIEVPTRYPSLVSLKKILSSSNWKNNKKEIPIILGKDVAGKPIITDLCNAPHLLIAGATGSGKSVCVNTLLTSLLYRFSPSELNLILVDPKVVEFEMYQKLPHLITPIVNEPKKVPLALRWAINEMERRYQILASVKMKNIQAFNARSKSSETEYDSNGNPIPEKLPYTVIIIDELADIMMTAKSEVETSISRIAQKARAVGIHLIIATQRPSVKIITGIIKANLPTRIAFRVTSVTDSRVILDHKGAESLLGSGDMLFIPPGSADTARIQGAMLSDKEIEDVVNFCSSQCEQNFDYSVFNPEPEENSQKQIGTIENGETEEDTTDDANIDEALVNKAIEIIKRERKASTSYIQRRLKIGYNRAAEIIDILESREIIGPQIGSARREILIDPES